MQTKLAFGKTGLNITLPDGPRYEVLHVRSESPVPNVNAALNAALDAPIGSLPLEEIARGKRTAAISVCDITRPAPNAITLPPVLARLHRAGLRAEDITICIATGLHREATSDELDTILGPTIASQYPIFNHDARIAKDHRHIGDTQRGTPVHIARPFLNADLHITLGFIEQHLMLGFSGGRKLIAPGLAAQQTIKVIHSPRFMREALATEGSIDDNPLHAELLEIARMARHDFMLDVTLTQGREISGIFAGDPVQAHAAGVAHLRNSSIEYLPHFVDAAITSAAGYPLDSSFYQTVKGITAVQHIVKPSGKILIASECSEGVGSPEFIQKLSAYRNPQSFLDEIKDSPVQVDQWQLEKLALVELKHHVLFYTPGIPPEQLGSLALQSFTTIESAVHSLLQGLPPDATVAIIPDGPYAYVRVRE
ncbi:MAG: nickel-dependent lactate racemase [Acidobacteriaceae bacterium]|nr:nickel-dependent lactate racemase [Acidobacteriaceae bacterium]